MYLRSVEIRRSSACSIFEIEVVPRSERLR